MIKCLYSDLRVTGFAERSQIANEVRALSGNSWRVVPMVLPEAYNSTRDTQYWGGG